MNILSVIKREPAFPFCLVVALIFFLETAQWNHIKSNAVLYCLTSFLLFFTIVVAAFQVVRHSDALSIKVGERFGTLLLTLSVVSMEVIVVSSVMVSGEYEPLLARDTMYSVIMIVMNGLVGITFLIGGYRYHTQFFNFMGTNAYLAAITPLALLCLVLPNFLRSSAAPIFVESQSLLLVILSLVLYGIFLLIHTTSHSYFFTYETIEEHETHEHDQHSFYYVFFLVMYLLIVVILSKRLATPIHDLSDLLHAPPALSGFIVACLILSPEATSAMKAALSNKLQRAVNIYCGSVLATIALTVPAVMIISYITGHVMILGLPPAEMVLLCITLLLSQISFSGGKTNVLNGTTHLVLFFVYLMIMFD